MAIGTVFISNGELVGSFKYAARARSNPTTDTFNAKKFKRTKNKGNTREKIATTFQMSYKEKMRCKTLTFVQF